MYRFLSRMVWFCIRCLEARIPFGDHPLTIGTLQRRLAWPLRKDDTHRSRSVNNNPVTPRPRYNTVTALTQDLAISHQRTNGVNTNGVTAIFMFFGRRYIWENPSKNSTIPSESVKIRQNPSESVRIRQTYVHVGYVLRIRQKVVLLQ